VTGFVVAFDVPHNEGLEQGIITGPGFDSGTALVDLYEVDAQIKSFATVEEARDWLASLRAENDSHPPHHDEEV
jgi:hypothetical protein